MLNRLRILTFVLLLAAAGPAIADDEVSVTMTVSPDTIGLNDQAVLLITIIGNRQNFPTPSLPNLSMFDYYSQGTSTNISINNGTIQSSLRYQYPS